MKVFMQNIAKFFGYTPTPALTTEQTTALKAIGEHFVGIANVLAEGNITPELCEIAYNQLYATKNAINGVVVQGWGGGKAAGY